MPIHSKTAFGLLGISTLFIALSVLLTGCEKDAVERVVLQTNLNCSFTAVYDGFSLAGNLSIDDSGSKISITSPETLKDIVMTMPPDSDDLTVTANGMKLEFDSEKYPQTAFAKMLIGTLQQAGTDELSSSYNSKNRRLCSKYQNVSFEMTLDEQNRPTKIEIPDYSFSAQLFNFA